jgi:hypothetical protein
VTSTTWRHANVGFIVRNENGAHHECADLHSQGDARGRDPCGGPDADTTDEPNETFSRP